VVDRAIARSESRDNSEKPACCPEEAADQQQPNRRLALVVEYDGSRYLGFQLQAGQPTIQGEIEAALTRFTGENIRVRAASRTDSSAHAQGQVVDFLTRASYPVGSFPRALNYYLPADIKIQAAYQVALEFHSRRDASSRTYRYYILNRPWPSPLHRQTHCWIKETLNVEKMAAAAQDLVGSHDFRPLAVGHPEDKSAVRSVSRWEVWREGDRVIIECEANAFLRHQIRRANAILVEIGKGRWPEKIVQGILKGGWPEGAVLPSLPGRGLCLIKVTYPDFWSKVIASDETD
jgi:tRNA pseudouridine38-40 synthase